MEAVHALGLLALVRRHRQAVADGDPLDDQNSVLHLDLADRLDLEGLPLHFDLTRLQRTRKRAGQSAPGCRHHVIQRGRMRRELLRRNPVVLRHLRMDAEHDRLLLDRKIRKTLRTAQTLDPNA